MLICKHCFLDAEMQSEVEANATSEVGCSKIESKSGIKNGVI